MLLLFYKKKLLFRQEIMTSCWKMSWQRLFFLFGSQNTLKFLQKRNKVQHTILFSNFFSTPTRRPELVDYFSGSSPSSSNGCRLTKTELMLNNRLTPTSTSHSTTFHASSPHATTLHIDASNNVTVRALVYRAQSPDSPQGEDGELRNPLNLWSVNALILGSVCHLIRSFQ